MKIKRTLTYEFSEENVKDFFESEWWEDVATIGEEEFTAFEDALADDVAIDEEWYYPVEVRETMTKIWENEKKKVHINRTRVEEELKYFQKELESNQKKIEELKQILSSMK